MWTLRYTLTPTAKPTGAVRSWRSGYLVAEADPGAAGGRVSGRERTHLARAQGL